MVSIMMYKIPLPCNKVVMPITVLWCSKHFLAASGNSPCTKFLSILLNRCRVRHDINAAPNLTTRQKLTFTKGMSLSLSNVVVSITVLCLKKLGQFLAASGKSPCVIRSNFLLGSPGGTAYHTWPKIQHHTSGSGSSAGTTSADRYSMQCLIHAGLLPAMWAQCWCTQQLWNV